MKSIIFWSMAVFVLYNQELFGKTIQVDELSIRYTEAISYDVEDVEFSDLFNTEQKSFMDIEFRIEISNSLKQLEEKPKYNHNFLDRVVVWMSYKF